MSGRRHARWLALPIVVTLVHVVSVAVAASPGVAGVLGGTPLPVAGVASFGIGSGQLGSPGSVALDGTGDLFVVDGPADRVVEYGFDPPSATYTRAGITVAGGGGAGSASSQLSNPGQIAVDASGDLFVADSGNHRVQEYAHVAGSRAYSQTARTVATVNGGVAGLALDANGDLFIADSVGQRVLEYIAVRGVVPNASRPRTVAGVGLGVGALALDASSDVFVVDATNSRVLEYPYQAEAGGWATGAMVAAAGIPGPVGGVALDGSDNLFVSYDNQGSGAVLKFAYDSAPGAYGGSGVPAGGPLVGPTGLAFDTQGNLFVATTAQVSPDADTVWDTVVEIPYDAPLRNVGLPAGTILGQQGRTNVGVSALAVDARDNLFVADRVDNRVYEFSPDPFAGTYSAAGQIVAGVGGPGGAADHLGQPTALAVDSRGDLFVVDWSDSKVLEYTSDPITGRYLGAGQPVPGATELSQVAPNALAVDQQGDLFATVANQVLEFPYNPASGNYPASGIPVVTESGSTGLSGMSFDAADDLFVADPGGSRVLEHLRNPVTGRYAGHGITVAGRVGDGNGAEQLSVPTSVALDHGGNLFVLDVGNARLMEYPVDPMKGTYGTSGTPVWSEPANRWSEEGGVVVDTQGDLFFDSNLTSATVYELAATAPVAAPPTTTPPTTTPPTTTPPATTPPQVTPPSSALDTVTADVSLPNEGYPHGVPSSYSFYNGPELDNPLPPGGMSAATSWGVIYEAAEGSPAVNTRVEVRDEELWLWSNSRKAWVEYQASLAPAGSDYYEPTGGPFANQSYAANLRTEADGGISVKMDHGAWFHFWPAQGRVSIAPSDIGGVFTTFQSRLVVDDPSKPDDTASARYLASAGSDWWATLDAPWPDNNQVFYDRFVYITPSWQSFYGASWSPAQLRQNPPPVAAGT